MYEVNYPPLTGATTVFVLSFASAISHCSCMLSVTDLYIYFLNKTKLVDSRFVKFATRSLAVAYVCTSNPRIRHSTVDPGT